MKTRLSTPPTPERRLRMPTTFPGRLTALAAFFLLACSSSDGGLNQNNKDGSTDHPTDTINKDSGPDVVKPDEGGTDTGVLCSLNGKSYNVGDTFVLVPGTCQTTCQCLSIGTLYCSSNCVLDGGTVDSRPGADGQPAVTCSHAGKTYVAGEPVPMGDGCGGTCVCMADSSLGYCSAACPADGGPDMPMDTRPFGVDGGDDRYGRDVPVDLPVDVPVDVPADLPTDQGAMDAICTTGAPCTLGSGGKGLCSAGICKACAGTQDDNACATVYGSGTLCADGQCVAGTCHTSTTCTGNKVCDSTRSCHNCASDLQCQNDAVYGRNTICMSNGQCTAGTCHASTDCEGKKLCDSTLHTCEVCTTDAQCQADTAYGVKSICVSSQCVAGTCATTADCKSMGRLCAAANKVCTECTADAQCKGDAAYGASNICVSGQCVSGTCNNSGQCPNGRICNTTSHACVACANDNQCKGDTTYGQHTLCLSGACTTGDCHDISSDCSTGRVCGSTVPHACGDCTTDTQCRQDTRYGTGYICVGNLCVQGNCHDTSTECNANTTPSTVNQVCGATKLHTCGACSDDDQCQNDTKYGANSICTKTAGLSTTGQCVGNACGTTASPLNKPCAANSDDFCCASGGGNKCVSGNCCADADCDANPKYGPTYFCRQNTCTQCDAVTGTSLNYLVDPIDGDDSMATGSGTAASGVTTPGCRFRTVYQALRAIKTSPATITIVGKAGTTPTSLHTVQGTGDTAPVEALPIIVPANVTITTSTGPINLTLPSTKIGFQLAGDQANLTPAQAAPLTIDGASHVSGNGIVVAAGTGTVVIKNVTVSNTGDDGIEVDSGTAQIREGVHVTGAGTATPAANRKNGMLVLGGAADITIADGLTAVFDNNTASGIAVSSTGVLTIKGVNTTAGAHSVQVKGNTDANVAVEPTLDAAAPTSVIDGLYSSVSQADGLRILAGRNLKVRNSIFEGNTGNGIRIASGGTGTTANSLASIDLGQLPLATAGNAGHNRLQAASSTSALRNSGSGLCIDLGTGTASGTLHTAGNLFGQLDCAAAAGLVRVTTSCTSSGTSVSDLGLATTATVDVSSCTTQ